MIRTRRLLRGVEPGRYIVEVPLMRRLYVESMQSGMTDLLREDLVVAPGAAVAPVEVRLRDDAATLDGKVKLDPDVKAAAVIAIPEETPKTREKRDRLSGQFNFPPLAPGRYRLFAVDRLDDFAYAEQDVIGKYLAHAKEVTLRANERTDGGIGICASGARGATVRNRGERARMTAFVLGIALAICASWVSVRAQTSPNGERKLPDCGNGGGCGERQAAWR